MIILILICYKVKSLIQMIHNYKMMMMMIWKLINKVLIIMMIRNKIMIILIKFKNNQVYQDHFLINKNILDLILLIKINLFSKKMIKIHVVLYLKLVFIRILILLNQNVDLVIITYVIIMDQFKLDNYNVFMMFLWM